ncbi:MAG: hypothetical protein M1823_006263, partial [Watsoniomyces obsoletus]
MEENIAPARPAGEVTAARERVEEMHQTRAVLEEGWDAAARASAKYYDRGRKHERFAVGQK